MTYNTAKRFVTISAIIALFAICSVFAFEHRGYFAIGGEWFVIIVPACIAFYKWVVDHV